jgi:hypothetical protein
LKWKWYGRNKARTVEYTVPVSPCASLARVILFLNASSFSKPTGSQTTV